MNFFDTNKEISPCIVSKARYELGLKYQKPNNKNKCSESYWKRAVETVAKTNDIKTEKITKAVNNFKLIFK